MLAGQSDIEAVIKLISHGQLRYCQITPVCSALNSIAYLWDAESLKGESVVVWSPMILDLRRWRRSCSSSLPGKAVSRGELVVAGDRPFPFMEEDGHPGWTLDRGVEAALILTREKEISFHLKKKWLWSYFINYAKWYYLKKTYSWYFLNLR